MNGMIFTDHWLDVPLDHQRPEGPGIRVFAREVVATENVGKDLPWLVFLQGGPGSGSPRPVESTGWLSHALRTRRVLLLDQRGTGRSTPITTRVAREMAPERLAAYIRHFRADNIVADAEMLRARLAGGQPWETLGQSYGGFVTLTYLSQAPQGLRACYITGGLPGLRARADDVYTRTFPRIQDKNAGFYRSYPEDVKTVRAIAEQLNATAVSLPDGDSLTVRRFRLLGQELGMRHGATKLHWLLEEAFDGPRLSDSFRYQVMAATGFVDRPLFALQEFIYGQGGATMWSADREWERRPEFADNATPLLFTGETMFRWMFADIAGLRPFAGAADILATVDDWPPLYDVDRLAANEVPVAAAIYFDDMYVDSGLQLETARHVGNTQAWVTNEFEHDGIRLDGERVLDHLMTMVLQGEVR